MAALPAGTKAPDFSLPVSGGKDSGKDGGEFSLQTALQQGPVLAAFFKVSCPTCQYALPFYERLFKAYKNQQVTLVGVSQNDAQDTAAFAREFGVHFPLLLDDTNRYPVSNAYGLTNVPTIFWIGTDGQIELTSIGWSKPDFDKVNQRLAEAASLVAASMFQPGEDVRDYRAG